MPNVRVQAEVALIEGGMNLQVSPMLAKSGTARLAYNYEYATQGGIEKALGIEPFDGQPSPSAAVYKLLRCAAPVTGIALGATVTGAISGAVGKVIYVDADTLAVTRRVGTFVLEDLTVASVVVATVSDTTPNIDGFLDNTLFKMAADEYQAVIGRVPGLGPVRGLAILNDVVYAWRNNALETAMAIYKSSATGWVNVPLLYELSFTGGSIEPAEGATLTQGAVTATVKRVALESGEFTTSNAAGRYIITAPAGGTFSAGAFTIAGNGTVPAVGPGVYQGTVIALAISGRVRTDAYNFTAAIEKKRLYGCDGKNREFEFDGTVLVPIVTGAAPIYATVVRCHKNHLFFGYRGSVAHSGVAAPYVWSVVFGAGELGSGDEVTNLISVGGSSTAAALMVLCRNALFVLYGNSTLDFEMVTLSRISGAQLDSAQDIGGVVALDTQGVMRYPATQNFGNFAWDTVSMQIQDIARDQQCSCSVFVTGRFKYRIFFQDGTGISGLPIANSQFAWSVLDVGRTVLFAEHAEIDQVARTFYADADGWVYEADKGRSMAGEAFQYAVKLHPMSQRSPMVEKLYRQGQIEIESESACTIYTSAEFSSTDESATEQTTTLQYGAAGIYDLKNYDQSYWSTASVSRRMVPVEGHGTGVSLSIAGESDKELSHTIRSVTVMYSPRRLTR